MDDILDFVEDYSKRLMRPVKDLEDVRQVMEALSTIRDNFIMMDMTLGPIEVCILKCIQANQTHTYTNTDKHIHTDTHTHKHKCTKTTRTQRMHFHTTFSPERNRIYATHKNYSWDAGIQCI